jgi:Domain of unknown function (DUF4920)
MKSLPRNMIELAAMAAGLVMAVTVNAADFGDKLPAGEPVAIDVAAANAAEHVGKPQLFAGRITEVCQKEGCWLMIEENGLAARVMTKDHAFVVPKDATGRAIVYGVLSENTLSPDAVKHLADDAGKGGREGHGPAKEYRIVASAISIVP